MQWHNPWGINSALTVGTFNAQNIVWYDMGFRYYIFYPLKTFISVLSKLVENYRELYLYNKISIPPLPLPSSAPFIPINSVAWDGTVMNVYPVGPCWETRKLWASLLARFRSCILIYVIISAEYQKIFIFSATMGSYKKSYMNKIGYCSVPIPPLAIAVILPSDAP